MIGIDGIRSVVEAQRQRQLLQIARENAVQRRPQNTAVRPPVDPSFGIGGAGLAPGALLPTVPDLVRKAAPPADLVVHAVRDLILSHLQTKREGAKSLSRERNYDDSGEAAMMNCGAADVSPSPSSRLVFREAQKGQLRVHTLTLTSVAPP